MKLPVRLQNWLQLDMCVDVIGRHSKRLFGKLRLNGRGMRVRIGVMLTCGELLVSNLVTTQWFAHPVHYSFGCLQWPHVLVSMNGIYGKLKLGMVTFCLHLVLRRVYWYRVPSCEFCLRRWSIALAL